ncbi:MAG: GGDEF and EAL domain-containing protein [Thermoanaerobaculia bacterium]
MPRKSRLKESPDTRPLSSVGEVHAVSDELPAESLLDGPDAVGVFDREGRALKVNGAALRAGAPSPTASPALLNKLPPFWNNEQERERIRGGAFHADGLQNEVVRFPEQGSAPERVYWVSVRGTSSGFVAVAREVTERIWEINELMATFESFVAASDRDPVTSFFTREQFRLLVERETRAAASSGRSVALLHFELDDFQLLNDTHGIASGDEFIVRLSEALRQTGRDGEVFGRVGGAEVAVLLPDLGAEQAAAEAERILTLVSRLPYFSDARTLTLTACAGLALFPEHAKGALELIQATAGALKDARRRGRGRFRIHDPADHERERVDRLRAQAERIRDDLTNGRFVPVFQPIAEIGTGRIVSVETLARRRDDDGKLGLPMEFLDAAERFGYVTEIDRAIIAGAFDAFASGRGRIDSELEMSLNLSALDFDDDRLVADISHMARRKGIRPERVTFEITETAALRELGRVQHFTQALTAEGFRFALDDFGIGFSSFRYLRELPVSCLKFDVSYVQNLPTQLENRVFVRGIAEICRGLGVKTVAEGVESASVMSILRELGVDRAQGYYIGYPSLELPARLGTSSGTFRAFPPPG